jgi:hypothetical protein
MTEDQQGQDRVSGPQVPVEEQAANVRESQSQPSPETPARPTTSKKKSLRLRTLFPILTIIYPFLTLIILACTLVVYYRQTGIMQTQADISKEQSEIANRQLQLATRPYITTKIENDPSNSSADKLIVQNLGVYPVRNLQLNAFYFGKIQNHGWYTVVPSGNIQYDQLSHQETWSIAINGFAKAFDRPFADSFSVEGNLEFVNFLISFEREYDGRGYVYIEPMILQGGQLFSFRDPISRMTHSVSGPLATVCHPAIELIFEYLQRSPLPRQNELYNYEYLQGYKPTGCLGPIQWMR